MITALLGGTSAMRDAGKIYLPQWPNEDGGFYKNRLNTATLFPAFARTIEVLSGKPFSRPVTWDEKKVPENIQAMFPDIDMQGTNLHSFLASICEEAMGYGICGILVEHPPSETGLSKAEEKRRGLRPYFAKIAGNSLLDFDSKRIDGQETFTMLRFVEVVSERDPANEFVEKQIEQVRVLNIGKWRTYREKKNETTGVVEWALHDEGTTSLQKITFVPVYGDRIGFMQAKPPMAELAFLNVEHWQSKSDQQTILHVARVPILFGRNLGDAPITVGAASAIVADEDNADLKYVEHTGKAIEAGRNDLRDLEDLMRQIGAELLVIKPGRQTVAQTVSDNEPGTCALQRIVGDLTDAANLALEYMADWIGETDGGSITIFRDFGATTLAEASAELLMDMNVAGTLSDETMFYEMQRRGLINSDVKWLEEKGRIASQPPKATKVSTTLTG
ncbi:DNA-binding protein [Erwinia billingiae]|nr:DNA-binding protein [Erwinia billingiae]